ncbi:MAG: acylphosphatase [Spirochaetia bacterium]|nr:acylphosphatase [Spirochaetia bacterium]
MKTIKIEIKGVVQGVGFRPFLYKIATINKLNGYAYNFSGGVVTEVQGKASDIKNYINTIKKNRQIFLILILLRFLNITHL